MPIIPPGSAPALRQAAQDVAEWLAPSGSETVTSTLMALRSVTQLRREDADESEATMRVIAADLAHVPPDIMRKACKAYRSKPGQRFFPRSSGELLAFIEPLLTFRRRAAARLRMMADAAKAADDEAARLAAVEEIPIAEIASWPPATRRTALDRGWITADQLAQAERPE